MAAAGIVTVIRALPTMYQSLRAVLGGLRGGDVAADGGAVPRTDRDIPGWVVVVAPMAVVLTLFAVPGLLGGNMSAGPRFVAALGVAIFGLAFVVVSSRIVGLIGVSSNPTSGMALVTLLGVSVVFVAMGWTDMAARAAILTVGTVVCVAASKAGDISQDLKTGQLVGATPARQQLGQFIAAAFACWAVAATVLVLNERLHVRVARSARAAGDVDAHRHRRRARRRLALGPGGHGRDVLACARCSPGCPASASRSASTCPSASLTPIFLGGIVRRIVEARRTGPPPESDPGVLASSGMIAGEGLAGVTIAFIIAAQKYRPEAGWSTTLASLHFGDRSYAHLGGLPGMVLGVAIVAGLCRPALPRRAIGVAGARRRSDSHHRTVGPRTSAPGRRCGASGRTAPSTRPARGRASA